MNQEKYSDRMKFNFLTLFIIFEVSHGEMTSRIVGGKRADINQWPFMVFLAFQDERAFGFNAVCGGSLLSSQTVLTAAHCLDDQLLGRPQWKGTIFMGGSNTKKMTLAREILNYRTHEKYDVNFNEYDLGVAFLERPVLFSSTVKRVLLLPHPVDDDSSALIAGWGSIYPNEHSSNPNLMALKQTVYSDRNCYRYMHAPVENGALCAGSSDHLKYPYKADSGGPLVTENGHQIGLVSYCWPNAPGYTVYTKISTYYHWIMKTQQYLYTHNCGRY